MGATTSKLELILLAKDKMSPTLQKLLSLLKKTKADGKSSTDAVDKLTRKLGITPKTDGLRKANAELKKTATVSNEAAKAEEKLNNVRKRGQRGNTGIKQETADIKKFGEVVGNAAKQEEKLNNARKRGSRRGGEKSSGVRRNNGSALFDDAALTGAGAGGLWLAKQGLNAGMTKQEAMTELRNSFYRSSVDAAQLNGQMLKAEEISERLGNKLPGNTASFLNLLATMKQRGVETQTILEGAGDAAAYLSVANKEDTQQVGENLAGFGQLFQLKGKEYIDAADLMSRIRTAKGLGSEELIEASKYFGGRNATPLGLTGMKGAEDTVRFLAFLRQNTKMEGSQLGTSSSQFFTQFVKAREGGKRTDPIGELKKLTGQSLNVFDAKGKFLGIENAIQEFAKLKGKLSNEQMVSFGTRIAGEEGASVFSALVEHGNEYKAFNQDINQSIGLMEKSAKNAENLSNKIEALTGSLENLGSAGFTPMLGSLGKLTDKTNDWVGSLTELTKANPDIARMATTILSVGSAFLTLKGGGGLLSKFIGGANNSFTTAWKSADGFQQKMGALRTAAANPISVSLQVMAAGMTIDHLLKVFEEVQERSKQLEENNKTLRQQYDSLMGAGKLYNYGKETGQNRPDLDAFADKILETMKQGRALEYSLQPERAGVFEHFWTTQRPYDSRWSTKVGDRFGSAFDADKAAAMWQSSDVASGFRDPNVLARVLAKVQSGAGMNLDDKGIKLLLSAIERTAGKEKTQVAQRYLTDEYHRSPVNLPNNNPINFNQLFSPLQQTFGQVQQPASLLGQDFSNLSGKTAPLGETFAGLNSNSGNASGSILSLGNSASGVAFKLSNLSIQAPNFGTVNFPAFGQSPKPANTFGNPNLQRLFGGGRAKGGSVTRGIEYRINEQGQEYFTPSASGSIISSDALRNAGRRRGSSAQNIKIEIPVSVVINGGDGGMNQAETKAMLKREMAIIMRDVMNPDRLAQMVEFAAQRDSERT